MSENTISENTFKSILNLILTDRDELHMWVTIYLFI